MVWIMDLGSLTHIFDSTEESLSSGFPTYKGMQFYTSRYTSCFETIIDTEVLGNQTVDDDIDLGMLASEL
jgi:hypothetical protein